MSETRGEMVEWLVENWTERLAQALETMTGERPAVSRRPGGGPPPEPANALWWEQALSLGPRALVWAGAAEADWGALGSFTLRGAGIEPAEPADARNTYLEILSQALAGFAQALGARLGSQVTCESGREAEAPPDSEALFEVEVTLGESSSAHLFVCFAPSVVDGMSGGEPGGASTELTQAPPLEPQPVPRAPDEPDDRGGKRLDLLMEVELPVSVSFGRAQMALKDVLKLSTGSIVELNRAITEPVEVIVNNCVIARGEVVVVEGNYGVRIHEIISREKRMRTLR